MVCLYNVIQFTAEQEAAMKKPIVERFEEEGSPYFSSARWAFVHDVPSLLDLLLMIIIIFTFQWAASVVDMLPRQQTNQIF